MLVSCQKTEHTMILFCKAPSNLPIQQFRAKERRLMRIRAQLLKCNWPSNRNSYIFFKSIKVWVDSSHEWLHMMEFLLIRWPVGVFIAKNQTTSVEIERFFSTAGLIVNKIRSNLKDVSIDMLRFLKVYFQKTFSFYITIFIVIITKMLIKTTFGILKNLEISHTEKTRDPVNPNLNCLWVFNFRISLC